MYKKYYSYNDMPVPITPKKSEVTMVSDSAPDTCKAVSGHTEKKEVCEKHNRSNATGGFLNNLQMDDIILIIVVLALIMEDCEDKILLAAIAFILFSS